MTTLVCATPNCGRTFRRKGRTHKYCGGCASERKRLSNSKSVKKRRRDLAWVYDQRQKQAAYALALKTEVLTHYSPGQKLGCSCPECPITAIELLGIDHKLVSGKFHRNKRGKKIAGLALYRWLRDHGLPDGYQTLCHGCNLAKAGERTCPRAGQKH